MNFKDMLERYKKGTATEEEEKLVKKELEKYESIEQYVSDKLPADFLDNEEYGDESLEKTHEMTNIKKVVNRKLAKVVLASVLIVILLYVGFFYGVSALVDHYHYDPTQITEYEDQEYPTPDFQFDMHAYVSLNMPGFVLNSFTSQESQGFGEYELSYSLRDLFSHREQIHVLNLSRGIFAGAIDGIYGTENRFNIWNGFESILDPLPEDASQESIEISEDLEDRQNNMTIDYLNELNPLSYISMSIVFEDDLTMEEFHALNNEHEELDFKWAGIRTKDPGTRWSEHYPMHLIGFNPNPEDESGSNMRPDPEKYPLFNLSEYWDLTPSSVDVFPEAFETHFKSRLAYIGDQDEFVEIVELNQYKVDFYNEALEYVEDNGVETYGARVYGTAESFSEYLNTIPYETLYINDVSSVKPNIYFD